MMKDITTTLTQDVANYESENTLTNMVLDELLVLTIKDLYNASYDLKTELAKENPSKRKLFSLRQELKGIIGYFNSPLYTAHCHTPKAVWLNWAKEAIEQPRVNINKIIDDSVGIKIKEYDFAFSNIVCRQRIK